MFLRLFLLAVFAVEMYQVGYDLQHEETIAFDFDAYMEQAQMVADGQRNYTAIRGDTGPLVYPAGHLVVYGSILKITGWDTTRWTTEYSPKNITGYESRTHRPDSVLFSLQIVFAGAYAVTLGIWLGFISRALPPLQWKGVWAALDYAARLLTIVVGVLKGRRARQVFALGLFNDAVGATVIALALVFLSRRRWLAGCLMYSFAVAVKMNNLLYAPGLAVLLWHYTGMKKTLGYIAACGALQVLLGAPFLLAHPMEYLAGAFNLGRQFDQQWSVNFVFLPAAVFSSKALALGLLLCTVAALLALRGTACALQRRTATEDSGVVHPGRHNSSVFEGPAVVLPSPDSKGKAQVSATEQGMVIEHHVLLVMAVSNIVGVTLARSIHFQFFVWYWHAVLLHAVCSRVTGVFWPVWGYFFMRYWEFHPPTVQSSAIVCTCHVLLLLSTFWGWRAHVPGLQQLASGAFRYQVLPSGKAKQD